MDTSTPNIMKFSQNFHFKKKYGKYFLIALLVSFFSHITVLLTMPELNAVIVSHDESNM